MTPEKVIGYVAWHPEEGIQPMNDDGDIGVITDEERCGYVYLCNPNSSTGIQLRKDGWRIRPITGFIFGDEK